MCRRTIFDSVSVRRRPSVKIPNCDGRYLPGDKDCSHGARRGTQSWVQIVKMLARLMLIFLHHETASRHFVYTSRYRGSRPLMAPFAQSDRPGGARQLCPCSSDLDPLCDFEGIVDYWPRPAQICDAFHALNQSDLDLPPHGELACGATFARPHPHRKYRPLPWRRWGTRRQHAGRPGRNRATCCRLQD
jgi:hypothetical protein